MGDEKDKPGLVERGVNALREGYETGKDAVEVVELADDFLLISESKNYFEENKKEFKKIGPMDVLRDTQDVQQMVDEANQHVQESLNAVAAMQQTEIKFSEKFMGKEIKDFKKVIKSFNKMIYDLVDIISDLLTNQGVPGQAARKATTAAGVAPKAKELIELNISVTQLKGNSLALQTGLDSLIDPDLEEETNNRVLNKYIDFESTVDTWMQVYEAAKKVKEAKEDLGI